ncbi:MAG: lytic transglycosylase domain-containing protein [Pseudomonadota bacterium]|nr:lytic transglycosylase domain-containing protein [Pseudomonadota bacterium]
MMTKTILWLGLFAVMAPLGAQAQVIEIDDSGDARTFDRPTVFAGSSAETIAPPAAKAARTQPALFAAAAKSHGLDLSLLEAVAWQESRGRMSAVSPKGALGVMQLMPGTAAEMGVRPDDLADNIRGGALYLRRQLDRFGGSVPLALAAYNAGPGAVLRYRGIPPYRETRDYVAKIMNRWRPTAPTAATAATLTPTSILSIEVPKP